MNPVIRHLGTVDYAATYQSMRNHVQTRARGDRDEFWLLEHFPVYTLGQAGKRQHILREGDIPIVQSDRGGQVTYHGPGQLIVYTLLDLKRHKLGPRTLVKRLEQVVIDTLDGFGIASARRSGAPGVYVDGEKIAALGLRIRNGFSYHGVALNIDMDLRPFDSINPCGYEGLRVTRLRDLGVEAGVEEIATALEPILLGAFSFESNPAAIRRSTAAA